jgi:isocitrate dehydrogenase
VQQFVGEGHLRWDSLGEFLALAVSIEELGIKTGNTRADVLAAALHEANNRFLTENKNPSRKVGELDTRGSHFYLALYWADALAVQNDDAELQQHFAPLAEKLNEYADQIEAELLAAQGKPVDIGGYYQPNTEKASEAMRPSPIFNAIVAEWG